MNGGHTTYKGGGNNNQRGYWRWGMGAWEVGGFADNQNGVNSGRCLDAYVDWSTIEGHYDQRVVRNCKGTSYRQSGPSGWLTEDPDGPRTIRGLQKGAGCLYDAVAPVSYLDCGQYPDNLPGCVVDDDFVSPFGDYRQRTWIRFVDGTIDLFDGGIPWNRTS